MTTFFILDTAFLVTQNGIRDGLVQAWSTADVFGHIIFLEQVNNDW
jgi:hypothetical protein